MRGGALHVRWSVEQRRADEVDFQGAARRQHASERAGELVVDPVLETLLVGHRGEIPELAVDLGLHLLEELRALLQILANQRQLAAEAREVQRLLGESEIAVEAPAELAEVEHRVREIAEQCARDVDPQRGGVVGRIDVQDVSTAVGQRELAGEIAGERQAQPQRVGRIGRNGAVDRGVILAAISAEVHG